MFYYVYKITSPTGQVYIGQCSTSLKQRWASHRCHWKKSRAENTVGVCPKLYAAFDLYDPYDDSLWIREIIYHCMNRAEIDAAEEKFIQKYNSIECGYNCVPGGKGRKGFSLSDAHKKNISKSLRGRKQSVEQKRNRSQSMIGTKMLPQTREAILASISKKWVVVQPNGCQIEIKNLKKYAQENGLTYGRLIQSGHSKGHKVISNE